MRASHLFPPLAVLSALLALLPASAQAPPAKRALLVGVNEYENDALKRLQYAVNDVTGLRDVLVKAGYEVVLLTADEGRRDAGRLPTKKNIEDRLKELTRRFKAGDTLLIGLAGHGVQFDQDEDGYFCPVDARPFVGRKDSLVSIKRIYDLLQEDAAAGTKLVLVDACRDNPQGGKGRGLDADSAPPPPRGVGVLVSCSANQQAMETDEYRHGVFFHHVIEGLKGKAADREGDVTWDDLRKYVKQQVTRDVPRLFGGKKQSPEESGRLAGDPPVLVHIGRDPRPAVTLKPAVTPKPPVSPGAAVSNSLGMKFVLVPKGSGWLGGGGGEKGTRKFTVDQDFYLGQFEVTQGQWKALMDGKNPSHFRDQKDADTLPVETVSWDEVQEFLRRFNAREGKTAGGRKYRLPTADEWEYACRGGPGSPDESAFHFYLDRPTNELSAADACFRGGPAVGNGPKGPEISSPRPVGSYKPNKLGLFDMHGNVWEWCDDLYDKGPSRVYRGGGWLRPESGCQARYRHGFSPSARFKDLGFRVAAVGGR